MCVCVCVKMSWSLSDSDQLTFFMVFNLEWVGGSGDGSACLRVSG